MGYKEKLKSYAEGKLEGKEKANVESDIDRQRAIDEYLEESMDSSIFEESRGEGETTAGKDGELSKLVQKAVDRKLKKFGIWTGTAVLAITLFLMFGLSPLVNAMYYDPGTKLPDPYSIYNKIDIPLAVYTELHCPGKYFAATKVEDEGFGKYRIKFTCLAPSYSSNFTTPQVYQFTIDKGKMQLDSPDWRDFHPLPFFSRNDFDADDPMNTLEIASKVNEEKLEKLPETAMVTAAFTFKADQSLDIVNDFRSDETMVTFVPVKINESDGENPTFGNFGFAPSYGFCTVLYDPEEYAYLFLNGGEETDARFTASGWIGTANVPVWERHFKSMLKYMDDQKEFRDVINYNVGQFYRYDYASALKYVEENGVKTYGVIVYGPVGDILRMAKDDRVKRMFVMDAKLVSISNWAW